MSDYCPSVNWMLTGAGLFALRVCPAASRGAGPPIGIGGETADENVAEVAESERNHAQKLTSIATAIAGGVSVAMTAVVSAPEMPVWVVVGIGVIGIFATKFAADWIDGLADKRGRDSQRPSA